MPSRHPSHKITLDPALATIDETAKPKIVHLNGDAAEGGGL
jgi:hypothetical protein